MKESSLTPILPAKLIKSWDAYTIKNISITSTELMEQAARVFCNWFSKEYADLSTTIIIVAGNGNNGGDGLAIARILTYLGYSVELVINSNSKKYSADRILNFERLPNNDGLTIHSIEQLQELLQSLNDRNAILIDAIFGIGITDPVRSPWDTTIYIINQHKEKYTILSIDLPSGLPADGVPHWPCIEADLTFSFETPKLSLLCPENACYSKSFVFESIGLATDYLDSITLDSYYLNATFIQSKINKRKKFDHKGTNGAVFQFCGSPEMPGAAILSSLSAFRSGAGYVYLYHPDINPSFLLPNCPEGIVLQSADIPSKANVLLAGCGIGTSSKVTASLKKLIASCRLSMVLDADALNIIADHPELLGSLPSQTIITPHPGEFDRLFGEHKSHLDRWNTQKEYSKTHELIIVLKGAHTSISDPDGNIYFNSTGNPALAKAGSGDVLSGMIAAFIAQGSPPLEAALCGVYIHGLASDIAVKTIHERSIMPSELTTFISDALRSIHEKV